MSGTPINKPFQKEINYFVDARKGPSRYFKQQRFFACEGLIVIVDERPTRKAGIQQQVVEEGDCVVLTPREFGKRIKAVLGTYRNKTYAEMQKGRGSDKRRYDLQAVAGYEAIREAKAMGDPSDPEVQAYWAKHHGKAYVSFSSDPDLSKIDDKRSEGCETALVSKGWKRSIVNDFLPKQIVLADKATPITAPVATTPAAKLILPDTLKKAED